jgi:hypothetical protein
MPLPLPSQISSTGDSAVDERDMGVVVVDERDRERGEGRNRHGLRRVASETTIVRPGRGGSTAQTGASEL